MYTVVATNLSARATSLPANPASANTNRTGVHRYRINKVVLAPSRSWTGTTGTTGPVLLVLATVVAEQPLRV